jgi:hypothetical protein
MRPADLPSPYGIEGLAGGGAANTSLAIFLNLGRVPTTTIRFMTHRFMTHRFMTHRFKVSVGRCKHDQSVQTIFPFDC